MSEQSVSGAVDAQPNAGDGVVSHSPRSVSTAPPNIVFRPIGELRPYVRNSRTHTDAQIEQIAASLVEFGWTMPVLEDRDGVVAGHARIRAASLVYEIGALLEFPNGAPIPFGTVPVLPCDGWSDERRKAYVIADNKLALNAGWDDEALAAEFQALLASDFDVAVLGFNDADTMFLTGAGGDFAPGTAGDQGKLDATKPIKCPSCGHEWTR